MKPDLLLVFTRCPEPGRVRTRLIPALGPTGAARLHQRLTAHTLRQAQTFAQPFSLPPHWFPVPCPCSPAALPNCTFLVK